MVNEKLTIHQVSDTAFWVAHYRAIESEQPYPLFHDPLAKILIGERGKKIADSMKETSRITRWSVVIRTSIIDTMLQQLAAEGIDTVINLGAGLDTRPYRLQLPPHLRWIEVDYPHVIEHKKRALMNQKPMVDLQRIALDLADDRQRQELFAKLNGLCKRAVVLTEGVLPYLTEDQVARLAKDLHAQPHFEFWIAEYFSSAIYRYLKNPKRMQRMKNAPFQFFPTDWFGFFKLQGWAPLETKYLVEESIKLGRAMPFPWWAKLIIPLLPAKKRSEHQRESGYVIYSKDLNPTKEHNMNELKVTDTVVGTGKEAVKGALLTMHYTGTLEDGTKFDSSHDRGTPFQFVLGAGRVIKGWDQGILGMKEGGKRTLHIPSHLAYGERQMGPVIKPNSNLLFDVELIECRPRD
jgi:methyltransferase (TIGR00027 family)